MVLRTLSVIIFHWKSICCACKLASLEGVSWSLFGVVHYDGVHAGVYHGWKVHILNKRRQWSKYLRKARTTSSPFVFTFCICVHLRLWNGQLLSGPGFTFGHKPLSPLPGGGHTVQREWLAHYLVNTKRANKYVSLKAGRVFGFKHSLAIAGWWSKNFKQKWIYILDFSKLLFCHVKMKRLVDFISVWLAHI